MAAQLERALAENKLLKTEKDQIAAERNVLRDLLHQMLPSSVAAETGASTSPAQQAAVTALLERLDAQKRGVNVPQSLLRSPSGLARAHAGRASGGPR